MESGEQCFAVLLADVVSVTRAASSPARIPLEDALP